MDFDDILAELGEMGQFQITTYILICLPVLFAGANSLSYVFTAGDSKYRCIIPECDDPDNPVYDEPWVKWAIPNAKNLSVTYVAAQCQRFRPYESIKNCSLSGFTDKVESCKGWVFDEENTIAKEFLITCPENRYKLSFVGNSHFFGILVGSFIFGVLSDKYGRKYTFIFSILLMSIAGVSHIVTSSYYGFMIVAFLHALGTAGVYPLGFVIGVELVGRKKRELTAMVVNFFYAIGEALLGVVAWYTKDWKWIQIAVSGPCIIFIVYVCFIPESVRWLLARSKNKRARGIIFKAAKINKIELSKEIEDSFKENSNLSVGNQSVTLWPVIRKVFNYKSLIVRFLIIFYLWAANAFIYYGLLLNSTSLLGNKYLNFILGCLIEIPGYCISWVALAKIGRKYSLIAFLFACGVVCALTVIIDEGIAWAHTVLFLFGKLCITASFGIIYVYTSELYPTVIRGAGIATASTIARIGALLAPFVPLLGLYQYYLPMMLFAAIATIAGGLAFKLPETLNKKLPETVEDAANI